MGNCWKVKIGKGRERKCAVLVGISSHPQAEGSHFFRKEVCKGQRHNTDDTPDPERAVVRGQLPADPTTIGHTQLLILSVAPGSFHSQPVCSTPLHIDTGVPTWNNEIAALGDEILLFCRISLVNDLRRELNRYVPLRGRSVGSNKHMDQSKPKTCRRRPHHITYVHPRSDPPLPSNPIKN